MNLMTYEDNDEVAVQYQRDSEKVTVRNVTKNTESVTFIKTDKNFPLYFAVVLVKDGNEVQIVEEGCRC